MTSTDTKFKNLFDSAVPGDGSGKIDSILRLCRKGLGMESGVICKLEGEINTIQHIDADNPVAKPGQRLLARETYCHHIHEVGDMIAYHDVKGTPYDGAPCHRIYNKNSVIGTPLYVEGHYIGTLIFSSPEARKEPFSEVERTMVALAAASIAQILAQGEIIRQLRQSNEQLDEYAHTIAHDMKQPLTVVEGYLEQMDFMLGDGTVDVNKMRRYIDTCRKASQGMEASIAYLLDFASATRSGAPRTEVDTGEMVRRIAAVMPYMHPETQSRVEIMTDMPVVMYDKLQLERVFSNLIENAVKYAQGGEAHVRIGAQRAGQEWIFTVTDNGIGIPAPQQARIFDVFMRGNHAQGTRGHGLGLAICRKIIEDHGGSIGVESMAGEGSRFYFTVPVA